MLSSGARQPEQEKPTVESVVYPIDVLGQLHPNGGLTNVTSYLKCYLTTCLADGAESETAIDHKIEQAMDLVKNHLLFAVHEEIELLKKQIVDLMSRNEQLEIENEFLRSMALPETLNQIKQQQQQPGQQQQQEQQQQNSVAVPPQPVFF